VKPIASDTTSLVYRVVCPGHDQDLSQVRSAFHIASLLEKVSAYASGGLAEELRDIEHAERVGAKPWR
jgi:hypothetical protein